MRKYLLPLVSTLAFMGSMFGRVLDPVVPQIATDFGISVTRAAMLATAFSLPYALAQPFLGALADFFGKARAMTVCVVALVFANMAGWVAAVFPQLIMARICSGAFAGGLAPVGIALVSDSVAIDKRQVALSRLVGASMLGGVIGSALAGLVGDRVGWRAILACATLVSAVGAVAAVFGFRGMPAPAARPFKLQHIAANFTQVLSHPKAKFCFGTVFVEGVTIYGLFPFVAVLLHRGGEERATIAGLVLSGFAMGGIVYSLAAPFIVRALSQRQMMMTGAAMCFAMLIFPATNPSWMLELIAFVLLGMGMFLIHSTVHLHVSELAPHARGSAVALHACAFFLGQAVGPLYYGTAMSLLGVPGSLLLSATLMLVTGIGSSYFLPRDLVPARA